MTVARDVPELSVVVALISGQVERLRSCLETLRIQKDCPSLEILVPYDPPVSDVCTLRRHFPDVCFLEAGDMDTIDARRGHSREHHDRLRSIGIRRARGRVIALTEDHARCSPTWCRDMVALIDAHPRAGAVGGAVECGSDRLLNWAVYYCDFGRYQNPVPEGPSRYVSDSNVAYRREALESVREAWEDDYHETLVHDALVRRGYELWLTPRSLVWQSRGDLTFGTCLRERLVWGRSFAGSRVQGMPALRRWMFAFGSAVLPALMTARVLRGALSRRRKIGRIIAALPWIAILHGFWAIGEFLGYASGRAGPAPPPKVSPRARSSKERPGVPARE